MGTSNFLTNNAKFQSVPKLVCILPSQGVSCFWMTVVSFIETQFYLACNEFWLRQSASQCSVQILDLSVDYVVCDVIANWISSYNRRNKIWSVFHRLFNKICFVLDWVVISSVFMQVLDFNWRSSNGKIWNILTFKSRNIWMSNY